MGIHGGLGGTLRPLGDPQVDVGPMGGLNAHVRGLGTHRGPVGRIWDTWGTHGGTWDP